MPCNWQCNNQLWFAFAACVHGRFAAKTIPLDSLALEWLKISRINPLIFAKKILVLKTNLPYRLQWVRRQYLCWLHLAIEQSC